MPDSQLLLGGGDTVEPGMAHLAQISSPPGSTESRLTTSRLPTESLRFLGQTVHAGDGNSLRADLKLVSFAPNGTWNRFGAPLR